MNALDRVIVGALIGSVFGQVTYAALHPGPFDRRRWWHRWSR